MVSPIDLPALQDLLAEADQHYAEWETDADSQVRTWGPLSDGDILAFDLRAAAQHRPGPFARQPDADDAGYDETGRPIIARLRYAFMPVTGILRRDGPTTDLIVIHRRAVISVARRVDHADGVATAFGALHRETDGVTRIVLELETYERATSDGPIVAANIERKTSSGKAFRRLDDDRLVIASSEEHGVESIWSADAGIVYRRPLMTSEVFKAYADSIVRRIAARLHELVLQYRDPEAPCQGLILEFTQASDPEYVAVPDVTLLAGARHLPPDEHWDAHEWKSALTGGRDLLDLPEYATELKALAAEVRAQGHWRDPGGSVRSV